MAFVILDNGKKRKKHAEPKIPDDLTEEEKRYIYKNPEGKIIFTPIYEIYSEAYLREIVGRVPIATDYARFSDTSWMEKYMTNLYQFSAAKSVEKARMMQEVVYSEDGTLNSWSDFRTLAGKIQEQENEVWLRVERDNCARQAIMADKFNDMRADADIYPYWIYKGRLDSRERPEHRALEGLIFRIGDPFGDDMFPPSDWNCRCTGKPVDDDYLKSKNRVVQTNEQARGWLQGVDENGAAFVDPQFRYNPANQGMLPKVGNQFVNFNSANDGDAKLFGVNGPDKPTLQKAEPLPYLPGLIESWKKDNHVDRLGNICFQNEELLSNIWFTHHSASVIHAHPRGADKLPDTVSNPSEVWSRWEDIESQQIVLRNYISFTSKDAYIVKTRQGAIQDAFTVSRSQSEKFRIGVPWLG